MKPQTPEELYEDKEDLADEGMLFIGDKGKILCDFRGNKPRLIPQSRQQAFEGSIVAQDFDTTRATTSGSTRSGAATKLEGQLRGRSPRSPKRSTLADIALRVPYKRLMWDAAKMEFTNSARGQQARTPRTDATGLGTDVTIARMYSAASCALLVGEVDADRLAVDERQRVAQLVARVARHSRCPACPARSRA